MINLTVLNYIWNSPEGLAKVAEDVILGDFLNCTTHEDFYMHALLRARFITRTPYTKLC